MNVKKMTILANEILPTINNLNPYFMKNIFTSKVNPKVRPNNLIVKRHNTTKYGTKSLTTLGTQIWNTLQENIKSETYYKNLINILTHDLGLSVTVITAKTTSNKR